MEKLNIAELLKDCPTGMELDCAMYDNVQFDTVQNGNIYPIKINTPEGRISLSKYGCYSLNPQCKCVIFPKGKTTWEGFQRPFKDGDVVVYDNPYREHLQIFIFKDKKGNDTLSTCYLMLDGDELDLEEGAYYVTRIATEGEKQKLFNAIKANGYKWNPETKTLEKKKKEYPKTYEECCKVLHYAYGQGITMRGVTGEEEELFRILIVLKRCRDAYWKIADWEPDWKMKSDNYNLIVYEGDVIKDINCGVNHVLVFPTEEMRDAFYENFKDLIEQCKELL